MLNYLSNSLLVYINEFTKEKQQLKKFNYILHRQKPLLLSATERQTHQEIIYIKTWQYHYIFLFEHFPRLKYAGFYLEQLACRMTLKRMFSNEKKAN